MGDCHAITTLQWLDQIRQFVVHSNHLNNFCSSLHYAYKKSRSTARVPTILLLLKFEDFSRTFKDSGVTFQGPIFVDIMAHYLTISDFVTLVQFYSIKARRGNYYQFLVLDKYLA